MNPQFKDNNFITIQGWMVSKLKLKANELLIYAIIYGFSQDDTSKFYGSITYLETAIGASRNTVISTLKKLTDSGLLIRTEFTENGVPRVMYKCNLKILGSAETEPVQDLSNGSANSDRGSAKIDRGSAETAPYNILNNKDIESNNINNNDFSNFENNESEDLDKIYNQWANKPKAPKEMNHDELLEHYIGYAKEICKETSWVEKFSMNFKIEKHVENAPFRFVLNEFIEEITMREIIHETKKKFKEHFVNWVKGKTHKELSAMWDKHRVNKKTNKYDDAWLRANLGG